MDIVQVEITSIRPYWRNPRKNANAVEAVKQSIQKYGFNVPIVLDGDNIIIAGHTRYKALLEMGAKTAPCIYSAMSAKQAKEYRIADNKTGELANWDIDYLKLEMRELDSIANLPGFSDVEMHSLMKDVIFSSPSIDQPLIDQPTVENTIDPGLPMGGITRRNVEQGIEADKFDKKQEELETRFESRSQEVQNNYTQVSCPHCGKEFIIDRRELDRSFND